MNRVERLFLSIYVDDFKMAGDAKALKAMWPKLGEKIDLEFLVQRQCRDTAAVVGLEDRGVIAPGYRADLNVIDFDRLRDRQPELLYDLPAGGRRIVQRADGYVHTIVAGVETYAEGEATGELPGRLIRGGRTAP